jgi:phosphonate transport system permease protein
MRPPLNDPDAKRRFVYFVLGFIILWPLLQLAQFNPLAFFERSNLEVMGNFLSQFFPPNLELGFLELILKATLETLAMATAGTALALLIAVPLGLTMTYSLSISRLGPANGHRIKRWMRSIARLLMVILRGIPEIVWALLFVRVFGLGAVAGVVAISITYGGMLAKVYAEILESSNTQVSRALLLTGSSRGSAFLYGLLPSAGQELASYTVYRWEAAVRASVVLGFVGAGGLGQLMDQSMKMLNGSEVSTILLVFLMLVLFADYLSWYVRRGLS